jgi:hypothetical protein
MNQKAKKSNDDLRYPAVPLITVDPYFSIWSFSDHLYDDSTRHWTGARNNMLGIIGIDGEYYRFMGKQNFDGRFSKECHVIPQISCKVFPLRTVYTFAKDGVLKLTITFTTPLLADDLDLMSRPISYISYDIKVLDNKEHKFILYFDISAEASINDVDQTISFGKNENEAFCGRGRTREMLTQSGDNRRIDWGWLHIFSKDFNPVIYSITEKAELFTSWHHHDWKTIDEQDLNTNIRFSKTYPSIGLIRELSSSDPEVLTGFICIGYDDIYSIRYMGKKIKSYCYKDGETFSDLQNKAIADYSDIMTKVVKFEDYLINKAKAVSTKYCDIISLAYRQAIGSHKLTYSNGEIQFFSKECFSNGCIGTVDVTYPSIPLFLLINPELICGMLNPVLRFASSEKWTFDFAPHDVGQYPIADGQVYGYDKENEKYLKSMQMPVEECGNVLISVTACCMALKKWEFAEKHYDILHKWCKYLEKYGLDPGNQLCTDDFAGHLAHNCNLSIKAILGIASFAVICKNIGLNEQYEKYMQKAKSLAATWKEKAAESDHTKLAFDKKDSWSLKYNLVWDKLLDINIFDRDIMRSEIEYYKSKLNSFGIPLDNRADYTKSDWQMWTTVLSDDQLYLNIVVNKMWKMLNETEDRVPFTDWYMTSKPDQIEFQCRTVQGGLFINLLKPLQE